MYNWAPRLAQFNLRLSKKGCCEAFPMLKVIIAIAAVVLSAEIVAISFAPGAEMAATAPAAPARALKGDRLDIRPITPVRKLEPAKPATQQVRQTRLA